MTDKVQSYVNSLLADTTHHPFMVVTTMHRGLLCSGRNEADVRNWVQHRWPECTILYVDPIHGPPKLRQ